MKPLIIRYRISKERHIWICSGERVERGFGSTASDAFVDYLKRNRL